MIVMQRPNPDSSDLPSDIENYRYLVPMEVVPRVNELLISSTLEQTTSCYKATFIKDGLAYCLRRLHGLALYKVFRLENNFHLFINL